jgi:hypothetical protein
MRYQMAMGALNLKPDPLMHGESEKSSGKRFAMSALGQSGHRIGVR